MSDHPKEADRNLKRIYICDDVCFDVFHFLTPAKVGLELALVSDTFDALVNTHFKYRKWTLGKLTINSKDIFKMNDDGTEKELPFPHKPLPNSIVGFASVHIGSINSGGSVAFLQCIGRLFESNVSLKLHIYENSNWNKYATFVRPLLHVSAVVKMHFEDPSYFRRFISPSFLFDCSNLRMICFNDDFFLQFPPDDSKGSSVGQLFCKWLHTPRADGQPKVFTSCWDGNKLTMGALKTSFLNATTSVSFIIIIIRLRVCSSVVPFELVNSLTREQLTIRKIVNEYGQALWLIERSPIDKCAEQWTEWKKEALEEGENNWKVLKIR